MPVGLAVVGAAVGVLAAAAGVGAARELLTDVRRERPLVAEQAERLFRELPADDRDLPVDAEVELDAEAGVADDVVLRREGVDRGLLQGAQRLQPDAPGVQKVQLYPQPRPRSA